MWVDPVGREMLRTQMMAKYRDSLWKLCSRAILCAASRVIKMHLCFAWGTLTIDIAKLRSTRTLSRAVEIDSTTKMWQVVDRWFMTCFYDSYSILSEWS